MPAASGGVRVWDLVVRVSHACVAVLVLTNYLRDEGDELHRLIGYAAASTVCIRLAWALFTAGHGGLRSLWPSWRATWAYLRQGAPRCVGHDPLGLWMVWLLWVLVLGLALTGWMSRLDAFWGDDRVTEWHEWLANGLIVAAGIHVGGVVAMSWRWKENLARAMVTGVKRPDDGPFGP